MSATQYTELTLKNFLFSTAGSPRSLEAQRSRRPEQLFRGSSFSASIAKRALNMFCFFGSL